jgi:hypothetical protein
MRISRYTEQLTAATVVSDEEVCFQGIPPKLILDPLVGAQGVIFIPKLLNTNSVWSVRNGYPETIEIAVRKRTARL